MQIPFTNLGFVFPQEGEGRGSYLPATLEDLPTEDGSISGRRNCTIKGRKGKSIVME